MSDPGAQQGMALQKVNIRGPREALAARAPVEPLVPETKDPPIELPQTSVVRRASVVLVVAPQFRIEGLLLLRHGVMPMLTAPFGHGLEGPRQALLPGNRTLRV